MSNNISIILIFNIIYIIIIYFLIININTFCNNSFKYFLKNKNNINLSNQLDKLERKLLQQF
ncbi:hypothetical protein PFUGPA_04340 [Plasmodium falciparum Palo Alto/Uganda]|nr:hypothetical protein PFFVO_05463 [Plasmodium falciparum Vietnam Oak-Knoll (FVO)]ETW54474.1 hypothetical protein PFUGPA_04340 [Plasmodium falciparum Palo Alto/Uganda]ETW58795.1 hypothetical protein PFMC_05888 [Plasmodium falciparum CAMP/Malaysia]EUR62174.1 hypothetical protein PFBG_05888 [Plasmodium falciparum 7G8]EWC87138.1 hypothetical protein PFNF54_04065 [Plasmodium falciparum NF54]